MPVAQWLRSVLTVWEAVQVELHGQYSVDRLRALQKYTTPVSTTSTTTTASTARAIAVLVSVPVPFLLLIISMDALPLVSPHEGITKQTIGFWVRALYTGWIMIFAAIVQIGIVVPSLPMSQTRLWTISLTIALLLQGSMYTGSVAISFPVPFMLQLQTLPWAILLATSLWLSWKRTLRTDAETKQSLVRVLKTAHAQLMILATYTTFNMAFHMSSTMVRNALVVLLPVIKLFFKNWVSRSFHHLEDFAPVAVVFIIDVFHSLFVSLAMQQSSSSSPSSSSSSSSSTSSAASAAGNSTGATIRVIMAVDTVQCVIALYEVYKIMQRIRMLAQSLHALEPRGASTGAGMPPPSTTPPCAISHAVWILDTNEHVRTHPEIARPRHLRCPPRQFLHQATLVSFRNLLGILDHQRIHPQEPEGIVPADPPRKLLVRNSSRPPPVPDTPPPADTAAEVQRLQVEYTQSVLKLLHLAEFYVLVEFVEVMVAAVYATYLSALSVLPNRVFYTQFAGFSGTQMLDTASQVAVYAALELLTFVVFCNVLNYQISHFSTFRQLAFVLETHWKLIQATFMMWVYLVVQLSLEHNGADYTFQFKWLAHSNSTAST